MTSMAADTLNFQNHRAGSKLAGLAWIRKGLVLAAVLALGIAGSNHLTDTEARAAINVRPEQARMLAAMSTGEQAGVMTTGKSAQERNALIRVSGLPLERPGRLAVLATGTPAYDTALKCLTQAIYYEAANEPLAGKRAVAQVVINRLRHPAYPDSVCGVVYEGSNKRVCQFSFTCDGSLLRAPSRLRWDESRRVAAAALAGETEASVGTATHYHADYVLPRWAFTLAKIEKIGAHIFYRFPGTWGRSGAFSDAWSGQEYIPQLDYARLRAELDGRLAGMEEAYVSGLTVTPHVADRHAANDVGGRLDTTKTWRLTIPDSVSVSQGYRATLSGQGGVAEAAPGMEQPQT